MKSSHQGIRSLLRANDAVLNGTICSSCRNQIIQIRRASTAAAITPTPSPIQDADHSPAALPKQRYQVRAGVVLSRPPLITRDLTPFEKSFYLYQRRLNERLSLPAMQYFYFRPNSPAMLEFKRKRRMRGGIAARDIGPYNPYDKDAGWNDEVLLGTELSNPEHQANELIKDSLPLPKETEGGELEEVVASSQDAVHTLMPRVTEADKKNDQKSLNRLLQRSLYLIVQDQKGQWTFPEGLVMGRESLALAAERILTRSGGDNMNTWIVGNHPVGHRVVDYQIEEGAKTKDNTSNAKEEAGDLVTTLGEKLFFMRGRIMAGQANLANNAFGLKDFRWLAREEIQALVEASYWSSIKNMLPAR